MDEKLESAASEGAFFSNLLRSRAPSFSPSGVVFHFGSSGILQLVWILESLSGVLERPVLFLDWREKGLLRQRIWRDWWFGSPAG